ncbi:uncharacterized protein LOC128988041 isoform X2 [Macrosteles quadrilineatus]|uniref:uncharacterized protein LOC128988041 isoform X2 n=1 Tax=Macrosteles quadrilineatus TaxID=74068 RepID=UPI0023E18CC1|nr:uncharacterized protein LOC128988041 isoform X2 [Macrosteles quadrilineatus]
MRTTLLLSLYVTFTLAFTFDRARISAIPGIGSSPEDNNQTTMLSHYQDRLSHYEDKLSFYENKLNHYYLLLYHEKLSFYEDKLSHYEDKLSHYEDKLSFYGNKSSQYEDKLSNCENKLSHYGDKLSSCENKLSHYGDKLSHYENKLSHYEYKLIQHEGKFSYYENRLSHYADKLNHYEDKLSHYEDKLSHYEDKLSLRSTYNIHPVTNVTHAESPSVNVTYALKGKKIGRAELEGDRDEAMTATSWKDDKPWKLDPLSEEYERPKEVSVLDLATKELLPPLRDEEYVQFRSIDYLYNERLIFYLANSCIMRATFDEDFQLSKETIIVNNTGDERISLAVDWVSRHLYWIEENGQRIIKSDLDGENQKIVVQNSRTYSFTFPNNIVVDPCNGLVFFVSNYAVYKIESNGDIKQIEIDGNHPGERERGVRTIALDRTRKYIYISGEEIKVADNTHYLARVRYDGSHIKEFPMKGMSDIFSMDVFDDTLYCAEFKPEVEERLLSVSTTISDKLSPTKLFVPRRYYQSIFDFKIYGPRIQKCTCS